MRSVLNGMIVLFCVIAASAAAEIVLDVDFDLPAYDTIAEIEADGWVFTGQEGTNVPSGYDIRWQNGEKTLYLDGKVNSHTVLCFAPAACSPPRVGL